MILRCENRSWPNQQLPAPKKYGKSSFKTSVASHSGWGELFDGTWHFWVVFREGCNCPKAEWEWQGFLRVGFVGSRNFQIQSWVFHWWFSLLAGSAVRPTFSSWRRPGSDTRESRVEGFSEIFGWKISQLPTWSFPVSVTFADSQRHLTSLCCSGGKKWIGKVVVKSVFLTHV